MTTLNQHRAAMLKAYDHIGDSYVLDGVDITGSKHDLTSEEMVNEGLDGLNSEAVRLCFDSALLTEIPVPQQAVVLAGETWNVSRVRRNGAILKLTLHRYTS